MRQKNEDIPNMDINIGVDSVLFFDMDGTLVDTDIANFFSYKKAIHSVTKSYENLNYNPDKRYTRSTIRIVVPNLSENEYDRIIKAKEEYYKDFLHVTKLNKAIAGVLFKYSKTNKTVLVTNCRKDRALTTLNYFGLTNKFDNIFFRQFTDINNEEKINKFQNAISILNISPKSVIAFENEESEIVDARNAGIQIINPIIL